MSKPETEPRDGTPRLHGADCSIGTRLSLPAWITSFVFIELVWTFAGGYATHVTGTLLAKLAIDTVLRSYLVLHVNFVILAAIIALFVRSVLHVPLSRFVTEAPRFRWTLALYACCAALACAALAMLALHVVAPGSISAAPRIGFSDWLKMASVVLIFTPLQCLAEELLFRTMLWRMLGQRRHILLAVSVATFTLAHLPNAEVLQSSQPWLAIAYYAVVALTFMHVTIESNGTEAAIGMHAGINLFTALLVNYRGSTMASKALFIRDQPIAWLSMATVGATVWIVTLVINKSGIRRDP
jgi:membrane protease YdiL (CAAX protease family)